MGILGRKIRVGKSEEVGMGSVCMWWGRRLGDDQGGGSRGALLNIQVFHFLGEETEARDGKGREGKGCTCGQSEVMTGSQLESRLPPIPGF